MQVFQKISENWKYLRSKPFFRIVTDKYVLITVAFLLICIFDHNGLATLLKNKNEIRHQQQAIEQYHKSIREIEERIRNLSTNKDSIEAFAREEYYYKKEKEDVFIVEE